MLQLGMFVYIGSVMANRAGREEDYSPLDAAPIYAVVRPEHDWTHTRRLNPVQLNWASVCSPNILRTVRRTMIRFLIELLVRRT